MKSQRLAQWAAIAGAIALLLTLLLYLAESRLTWLIFGLLATGVLSLGFWIIAAPDELRGWLSGRRAYYGTGSIISIIVVIGLAVIGYVLAERQHIVRDLTEYQIYTISQPALTAMDRLETRLATNNLTARIIGFYGREDLREQKATEFMLRQFIEKSSGRINLEFIDPLVEPLLARQFGYGTSGLETGPLYLAIFDTADERIAVEPIAGTNERAVATAMLRMAAAGQFKVYFITGHLEYETSSTSNLGLSGVYNTLPQAGITVEMLTLSQVDAIPDDATAIIIAGAQSPFSADDVAKIDAYIQRGGRMLILADPPYVDARPSAFGNNLFLLEDSPFNQYLQDEFGVLLREDLIADPGSSLGNDLFIVANRIYRSAGVLANFERLEILFNLARSLEITREPSGNQTHYVREIMLETSDQAYGETSLQNMERSQLTEYDAGADRSGPLVIAVAIRRFDETNQDIQPRVIIIGDTDWLTNATIRPEDGSQGVLGNILLWNNVVEWLTQYSEIAAIQPASRPDLLPIFVTDQQQAHIQLMTMVLLPGLVLGMGVLVWATRQRY